MKKHILNAAGAIGTVVGVSSIISLIDTSMEAGWSPLIRKAIDFYEKQKRNSQAPSPITGCSGAAVRAGR
jgi:hypothetical protein